MFEKIEIKREAKSQRLRIEALEGGALLVRAPRFLSEAKCMEFIRQNSAKIQKMVKKQLEFEAKREALGGCFLYLGSKMPIKFDVDIRKKYLFENGALVLSKKEHFREFLKDEAKRIITPKVEDIAAFYGVKYEKVSFRDTKSRWGSCSSKKSLSFSYRLIGAPKSVIEYVVIHEICHLKELNHSARFWSHVSALLPNYKESEMWLKENGRLLFLY